MNLIFVALTTTAFVKSCLSLSYGCPDSPLSSALGYRSDDTKYLSKSPWNIKDISIVTMILSHCHNQSSVMVQLAAEMKSNNTDIKL